MSWASFLEQNSYILLPRNAILAYHSNFKIWSYYWVDFILEENAPDCTGQSCMRHTQTMKKAVSGIIDRRGAAPG